MTTGWRALDEVVARAGLRHNPPVAGQAYRPGGSTWHGVEPGGHARDYGLIDADGHGIAELFRPLAIGRPDLIPEMFGSDGIGHNDGVPYQAPGHTDDHTHIAIAPGVTAADLIAALGDHITQEDPYMALSPEQQAEMYETTKATNAAMARVETAVRDGQSGIQVQIDRLTAEVKALAAKG